MPATGPYSAIASRGQIELPYPPRLPYGSPFLVWVCPELRGIARYPETPEKLKTIDKSQTENPRLDV